MTSLRSSCIVSGVKSRVPFLLSAVASLSAVLGACTSTNNNALPGTPAGTFNVVGTLGTNTCGSGIGLADPWNFQIQMSVDETLLYFAATDGSSEMSGPIIGTSAVLTASGTGTAAATDAGTPDGPCSLTLTATFTFDLDSATAPTRFTGSVTYGYAVAAGTNNSVACMAQLSSSGGDYATLPCNFTYSLTGTRQ
jgi:hypothetical protein